MSISQAAQAPILILEQITIARNLINAALDVVDVTKWTGDPKDADFISGQFRLLFENVQEAKQALKGGHPSLTSWWDNTHEDGVSQNPHPFDA